MKFSEWKECLCFWVTKCKCHMEPPKSLDEANVEEFFAQYIKTIQLHISSETSTSLLIFLTENYPEFKYFLNTNGCIRITDYIFVYSILLHYGCVRKPCPQLKLQSSVAQHYISQFLRRCQIGNIFTRQALHLLILNIPSLIEEGSNNGDSIDDTKNITLASGEEGGCNNSGQLLEAWQREELEMRFRLIKKRLRKGIRNANLLSASLNRSTLLFGCHGYKVANLLPQICTFRPIHNNNDPHIEQCDYIVSKLIILMQKHNMQMPILNRTDSIYTQLLSSIVYSLDQSSYATKSDEPGRRLIPDNTDTLGLEPKIRMRVNKELRILKGLLDELSTALILSEVHPFTEEIHGKLDVIISSYQNLEKAIKQTAAEEQEEEATRMLSDGDSDRDQEIMELKTQLNAQRQSAIDLLEIFKGTYDGTIDLDDSTLDSGLCFRKLHLHFKRFCMSYKRLSRERNHLDTRVKFLYRQMTVSLPSRNQMIYIWNQFDQLLNDLQTSYDMLVEKLLMARHQLNRFSQASYGFSEWVDELRQKFSMQVRISAVKQLQELMARTDLSQETWSLQLMIKKLQLQCARAISDRKFTIKRLKKKLNTQRRRRRRKSGLSVTQMRLLRQKLTIANQRIQLMMQQTHVQENLSKLQIDQHGIPIIPQLQLVELKDSNADLMQIKQQISMRDAYIEKLSDSRQQLQQQLLAKVGKIEELQQINEGLQRDFQHKLLQLKVVGNASDLNRSLANLNVLEDKSKNELATLREEVKKLQAQLEHQKHCEIHVDDKQELKKVVAVTPSSALMLSRIPRLNPLLPAPRIAETSLLEQQTQPKSGEVDARHTPPAAPPAAAASSTTSLCTPAAATTAELQELLEFEEEEQLHRAQDKYGAEHRQIAELQEMHEHAQTRILQKEQELHQVEAECAELKLSAKTQADLNEELKKFHKIRSAKYLKTDRKNKKLLKQLKRFRVKVHVAKRVQVLWSSQNMDSDQWRQLETLRRNKRDTSDGQLQRLPKESKNNAKLEGLRSKLHSELDEQRRIRQTLENQNKTLQAEINKNIQNFGNLENDNMQLKDSLAERETKIESLKNDNTNLHKECKQFEMLKNEYTILENFNHQLQKDIDVRQKQLDKLENEKRDLREELQQTGGRKTNYLQLEDFNTKLQKSFDAQVKQLEKLENEKKDLQKDFDIQKKQLDKLEKLKDEKNDIHVKLQLVKDWRSDYLQLEDANTKLQKSFDEQKKELEKVESEKKDLHQELKLAQESKSEYLQLKDPNTKLQKSFDVQKRQLEELENEMKELREELKKWKSSCHQMADTNSTLRKNLSLQQDRVEVLQDEKKKLYEELKIAGDCDTVHLELKEAKRELKNALDAIEKLEKEKRDLDEELKKQCDNWKSDYLNLKEINSQLKKTSDAREEQLEKMETEQRNLQEKLKRTEEWESNYIKLRENKNELENLLNDRERDVVKMETELNNLYEELKHTGDLSSELHTIQNALDAQEKRLEELEYEKNDLYEQLKLGENSNWDYLKLMDLNSELQAALDAKTKLLEKLEEEKQDLNEELEQATERMCEQQTALELREKRYENLQIENKELREEVKEAGDCLSDYLNIKDNNSELRSKLNAREKKVEKLEIEMHDLQEKLKKTEEWKFDYLKLKEIHKELQNALDVREKQVEKLEDEIKDVYVELTQAGEMKCDYLKLKNTNSELQDALNAQVKRVEQLEIEKKDLSQQLKQDENSNCDYLKLMEINSELKTSLDAKSKRLEKLEEEKYGLHEELKQAADRMCELQNALDAQEKRVKELEDEKKDLYDEIKQGQNWNCDYLKLMDVNCELRTTLDAKTKRLERLEEEKKDLDEELKQTTDRMCEYHKLKNASSELQSALDARAKRVTELEEENESLQTRQKQLKLKMHNYHKLKDAQSDAERARLAQEQRYRILQEEYNDLSAEFKQTLYWEKEYRRREVTYTELKNTLTAQDKQLQRLQNKILELESIDHGPNAAGDSNRNDRELLNRIEILQSEKSELFAKFSQGQEQLGQCEQKIWKLEKENAAITYRMRKIDDSKSILGQIEEKTSEQENEKKALEQQITSLKLEIGRLNALVARQERSDGDYQLPLPSSSPFSTSASTSSNSSRFLDQNLQISGRPTAKDNIPSTSQKLPSMSYSSGFHFH